MDLTAKAQKVDMSDIVGVSNVSVNLAKKHLLNDLLLDVFVDFKRWNKNDVKVHSAVY